MVEVLDFLLDMSGLWIFFFIIFLLVFLHFVPIRLWIAAKAANVSVGIFTLVGMRLRQVIPMSTSDSLWKCISAFTTISTGKGMGMFMRMFGMAGI